MWTDFKFSSWPELGVKYRHIKKSLRSHGHKYRQYESEGVARKDFHLHRFRRRSIFMPVSLRGLDT
jgi:hypothetical protein